MTRRNESGLLSAQGTVLLYLIENGASTHRKISDDLGITEKTVSRAITNLSAAGFMRSERVGRSAAQVLINPVAQEFARSYRSLLSSGG